MRIVADNIQIINPQIADGVAKLDPEPIQELVRKCESAGAEVLDINSGPLSRNSEEIMTFLIEAVQGVTNLPVLLDTSNSKALEAGLKACKGRAIINGFSLEPQKIEKILPLASKYGVEIIGYLLFPDSHVPKDTSERLTVAVELLGEAEKAGVGREQIIIDPVIVPLLWQDGVQQARSVLEVIRMLPELVGQKLNTIAGISNLTTGEGEMSKKMILEQAYLAMLADAGLDFAMLNVFHSDSVAHIKACKTLLNSNIFCWAEL